MNDFLNKTQVCTTEEQSNKLIKMGLNIETADVCFYKPYPGEPHEIVFRKPYYGDDIPAWSLHRLISLREIGMKEHNNRNTVS